MYYLVIKNLGIERCIDRNKQDNFKTTKVVDCQRSLSFKTGRFVRNIKVRCIESPAILLDAVVYADET